MTHNPDTMTHDCCATWHLIGVKIPFESYEQAKRYQDSRPRNKPLARPFSLQCVLV